MEFALFGVIAAVIVGLLIWQERVRTRVKQGRAIDAPVPRRGLIETAAIVGPTVVAGLIGAMAASVENWLVAVGFGGACALGASALWFTRRPLGLLRLDSDRQVLSFEGAGTRTQLELGQPFTLDSRLKFPLLRRGRPSMIVTVAQGASTLTYWFPWTFHELNATPSAQTDEPLPQIRTDWRGGLIFERLRVLAPAPTSSSPSPEAR